MGRLGNAVHLRGAKSGRHDLSLLRFSGRKVCVPTRTIALRPLADDAGQIGVWGFFAMGSARRQLGRCPPRRESRMCSSSQQNFGRLLSHAEPNYSGCCATFGPGGSLKGSRTFLANGRNEYFAIIARDSISRPLDVMQSACLPRIAFRA